jgi:hypothetical protein
VLRFAAIFILAVSAADVAHSQQSVANSPIIGAWTAPVGAGRNACRADIIIESVSATGEVKGNLHILGGGCGDTTRIFGEDQSPPIHTKFDGVRLKIWYLNNGTRLALKLQDGKFVGRLVNVPSGGTTGITDLKEDGTPVGDLNTQPGTREVPFDLVFTRS